MVKSRSKTTVPFIPSPEEIEREASRIAENNRKRKFERTHRKGSTWNKGDAAWVLDPDKEHYFGELIEEPYPCSDGEFRVTIRAADGDWEVKLCDLRLEKPINIAKPTIDLSFKKERDMVAPKSKKKIVATSKKAQETLCHCGCGFPTKPKRNFLQGHDARFHGRVLKLKDGRLTMAQLKKDINSYAIPTYEAALKDSKPKAKPKAKPVQASK